MNGNGKSFYQQNVLIGEKTIFLAKMFPSTSREFWIKNYRKVFFTQLNVCMFLNAEMVLPIWDGNGDVFLCSLLNPVLFWNCSRNIGDQTLVSPKYNFSLSPFSLN